MENDATNGIGWRLAIQMALADLHICWLNPANKPTTIGHETLETKAELMQARQACDYDAVRNIMKVIRCVDLRMTDISDFMVVNLDPNVPTFGTHEEIANANRQKKPIIIHLVSGKENTPLWLLAMLPHQLIFSSWDEIYQYLRHVAHDPIIDRLNRWYFFNFPVSDKSNEA
jgi:hypothetical protein